MGDGRSRKVTGMQQPQPVVGLGYYGGEDIRGNNVAILLGWLALLIGGLAVLCDITMLGGLFWDNPFRRATGLPAVYFYRYLSSALIGSLEHGLLALTGLMVLLRSQFAWNLLLAYIGAAMLRLAANILLGVFEAITAGRGPMGAVQSIVQTTTSLAFIVFLLTMMLIVCHPTVREMLLRAIVRPSRPPQG